VVILSAIIVNHVQSLLNGTLSSSLPDSSSSSNPILSSLTFSNQTDQNDMYNVKQGLSEEIHEMHRGDIYLIDEYSNRQHICEFPTLDYIESGERNTN
jgi:hypothetical protein